MSAAETLGLSDEEWLSLDPELQDKLIKKQAALMAHKQLLGTQMLEDDDRDIRRRTDGAYRSLMGQDANQCDDVPIETEAPEDVRITVLGDLNSEKAIELMSKASDTKTNVDQSVGKRVPEEPGKAPVEPAPSEPRKTPWWVTALVTAALMALTVLGTLGIVNWLSGGETAYTIEAIPYRDQ